MASMPATASADSLNGADMAAYLPDFGAVAAAAAVITPPTVPDDFANYAISISGISLYSSGTATAYSTLGNIAIAQGDHASANAYNSGFFNFASADGDNSLASDNLGAGWFNSATAVGEHSTAGAGGVFGAGSFNVASATGYDAQAYAGYASGEFAGGSSNTATAEGTLAVATAGADGSSNNVASAIGDFSHDAVPAAASAAATDNWLTELVSSLGGGSAAAESSNWLTELLGSFDGASAAADSSNLWTELSTLF
jgi:hypothetical protein